MHTDLSEQHIRLPKKQTKLLFEHDTDTMSSLSRANGLFLSTEGLCLQWKGKQVLFVLSLFNSDPIQRWVYSSGWIKWVSKTEYSADQKIVQRNDSWASGFTLLSLFVIDFYFLVRLHKARIFDVLCGTVFLGVFWKNVFSDDQLLV